MAVKLHTLYVYVYEVEPKKDLTSELLIASDTWKWSSPYSEVTSSRKTQVIVKVRIIFLRSVNYLNYLYHKLLFFINSKKLTILIDLLCLQYISVLLGGKYVLHEVCA